MKSSLFLRLNLMLGMLCSPLLQAVEPAAESRTLLSTLVEADPLVQRAHAALLNMQRFSWEQGVLSQFYVEAGDAEMQAVCARAMAMRINKEGCVAAIGGAPVDPLMGGECLHRAAQATQDPVLLEADRGMLEFARKGAGRSAEGIVYHGNFTIWSDTTHTAAPYLAAAGDYEDAVRQIKGIHKILWNPKLHVVAHIWDDKAKNFRDPNGWGSGIGWTAVGTMRVIRSLPPKMSAEKQELVALYREIVDGMLTYQRPDGLFPNIVEKADTFPEVCSAQMLAFSIFEGIRGGWLPATPYKAAADKMRAAARAKVDAGGFVQSVAGSPGFNRPGISPEGQAFFLMMETAAKKLAAGL